MNNENKKSNVEIFKKGNITLTVDLSGTKGKKVMYYDGDIVVLGVNNKPTALFLTEGFNFNEIPDQLKNDIHNVKAVYLKYSDAEDFSLVKPVIPEFKIKFNDLEKMVISGFNLNNFSELECFSITHLSLYNVQITKTDSFLKDISKFKNLKYLVLDDTLNIGNTEKVKSSLPELMIYRKSDYESKIKQGLLKDEW